MTIATYDPGLSILVWAGIQFSGFMDGTFISIEMLEDRYTVGAGADGQPYRTRNRNRIGSITAILQQSSPVNDLLMARAILDDPESPGIAPTGSGSVFFKELNGTTRARAGDAWLRKVPKIDRAKEFQGVEWILDCGILKPFVGSLATLL
jgi:hypothetical protein